MKTKSKKVATRGTDDQLMAIAAFRYCLGRQSYIVGSCLDWLAANWAWFEDNTKNVIVCDIVEALMDGHAGSPTIDVPGWKRFAESAFTKLNAKQIYWLYGSIAHKTQPWPLNVGTGKQAVISANSGHDDPLD